MVAPKYTAVCLPKSVMHIQPKLPPTSSLIHRTLANSIIAQLYQNKYCHNLDLSYSQAGCFLKTGSNLYFLENCSAVRSGSLDGRKLSSWSQVLCSGCCLFCGFVVIVASLPPSGRELHLTIAPRCVLGLVLALLAALLRGLISIKDSWFSPVHTFIVFALYCYGNIQI